MSGPTKAELVAAKASELAEARDADIIVLNSPIEGSIDSDVVTIVTGRKARRKNVIVFLVTEGGSADAAFRIARCFQACYSRFTIVVAGWCKSAGTLISVGANDLVMGDLGELGPLDVQLAKPDELGVISSGLTIESSFRSLQAAAFQMFESCLLDILGKSGGRVTTKTAAELAVSITTGLFSPIYQQMDPAKIGEDYRSTRIAEEYAWRLDSFAQNLKADGGVDPVELLVRAYPSHGFVIDRTEAQSIFRRVAPLDDALSELANLMGTAVIRPRPAVQSIVNYVNPETNHAQELKGDGAQDKPPARRRRKQGAKAGGSIPEDTSAGDGVIALQVANGASRAAR